MTDKPIKLQGQFLKSETIKKTRAKAKYEPPMGTIKFTPMRHKGAYGNE
jgi:hypothetical protein